MSLSNPSQLLMRNDDLLKSTTPLIVGCPDADFFNQLASLNPTANINSYQVNYAQHQAINSLPLSIHCYFGEHYKSTVKHDLVIIYFPKSKLEFNFYLAMLAPYLCKDATILVVGENKGGVKSTEKLSKEISQNINKVDSARHCSLYEIIFNNHSAEFILDDWYKNFTISVANTTINVASLPGVFSQGELDNGTQLLLQHLPKRMHGKVLDFGCGAGIIGCFVKKLYPETNIEMLDVNALAIASATRTLALNNLTGAVYASDGLSNVNGLYHAVLSNPPFHQGIKTNYHTTELFLKDIKKHLRKSGTLTIVANNFLKYAPIIKAQINTPELLANSKGFAIHHCSNP